MTTTLVSALLHIDDPRPRLADKHRHHYREWVKRVLGLDVPLVFYGDTHYDSFVSGETRSKKTFKGLLWQTEFPQLDAFKDFHAPVVALMESPAFQSKSYDHNGLQWTQPLYLMVIFQKLYWLVETATQNPFATEWFCWIDAGGIRHPIEPGMVWPKTNKLDSERVNIFRVSELRQIPEDKWERHCLSHAAMLAATCFIGKREPLQRFLELFKAMVNECLQKGFVGSEQKMYDFVYSRWPELFNVLDASGVESEQKDVWFKFFDFLR